MTTYRIVRHYFEISKPARVRMRGLSLEEARAHCRDPNTHSKYWFDGYEAEG